MLSYCIYYSSLLMLLYPLYSDLIQFQYNLPSICPKNVFYHFHYLIILFIHLLKYKILHLYSKNQHYYKYLVFYNFLNSTFLCNYLLIKLINNFHFLCIKFNLSYYQKLEYIYSLIILFYQKYIRLRILLFYHLNDQHTTCHLIFLNNSQTHSNHLLISSNTIILTIYFEILNIYKNI